jgi:diguanylate cyclase (GGDEF)-like protein
MDFVDDIFNREKEFDEKVEAIVEVINTEKDEKVREEKIRELFTGIKRAYLQAHFDAITDSMTGCFNKKHIREIFHYQYAAAKRTEQYFSLAVIDIDYLKYINDTFGHHTGDQIIRKIAEVLTRSVRESDIVFRFGGDEFVLFCTHNKKAGMKKIESRIQKEISEIKAAKSFKPSVTIGYVCCDTKKIQNQAYKDLFKQADEVLYAEKHKRKPPKFLVRK